MKLNPIRNRKGRNYGISLIGWRLILTFFYRLHKGFMISTEHFQNRLLLHNLGLKWWINSFIQSAMTHSFFSGFFHFDVCKLLWFSEKFCHFFCTLMAWFALQGSSPAAGTPCVTCTDCNWMPGITKHQSKYWSVQLSLNIDGYYFEH